MGAGRRRRRAAVAAGAVLLAAAVAATVRLGMGEGAAPSRGGAAPRQTPPGLETTVTRIVDGDTLYVADLDTRLRLVGIDAPETRHPARGVECFGQHASRHLAQLAPPGTAVVVEFDVERRDRHGRPLGYLWRSDDGLHVNLAMVADGYAQTYTVPPNVIYVEQFLAAERAARRAGRGLWSACR